jgi:hypothetical protein
MPVQLAQGPGSTMSNAPGRRVPDPVADRERAELREIAVVEHEEEDAGAGPKPLDRVAMSAREIPDVAGAEIHRLPLTGGIDGGDTAIALDDVAYSGGIGVPVKLAQRAGLEHHVNAGQLFRDREAGDTRFLGGAAVELLGLLRPEGVAERGQFGPVERRRCRSIRRLLRFGAERGSLPLLQAYRAGIFRSRPTPPNTHAIPRSEGICRMSAKEGSLGRCPNPLSADPATSKCNGSAVS